MAQYAANYFTGANVSLMIGPNLISQAFGLSWEVSQSKVPIYGYRSQYFDAIADGQVLVTGQIYVNFVRANYLSVLIRRYHSLEAAISTAVSDGQGDSLLRYFEAQEKTRPLLGLVRDILDRPYRNTQDEYRSYDRYGNTSPISTTFQGNDFPTTADRTNLFNESIPHRTLRLNSSDSYRLEALDVALDAIFSSESTISDLTTILTGGMVTSQMVLENQQTSDTLVERTIAPSNQLVSPVERNVHRAAASNALLNLARPDQFGSASQGPHGIDIQVLFGPPYGENNQNRIYNYSNTTAFMLRDIRFIGESGTVSSDNSPILEVYNFVARKKENIARSTGTSPSI